MLNSNNFILTIRLSPDRGVYYEELNILQVSFVLWNSSLETKQFYHNFVLSKSSRLIFTNTTDIALGEMPFSFEQSNLWWKLRFIQESLNCQKTKLNSMIATWIFFTDKFLMCFLAKSYWTLPQFWIIQDSLSCIKQ